MGKGTQINLGAGKRNWPGFTNVDLADFPHIHHKQDVRDLSNFDDNSVELIHASHVLEYFDRQEAVDALKEWKRVLEPGGKLRVAVPDFERLMIVYKLGGLDSILGPLYGKMSMGKDTIYHKTVYDFLSLYRLLESVGFSKINKYDWRKTDYAEHDDHSQAYFPHMDKENGMLISLNLEATK